jgi:hypothetical protein
MKDLDSWFRFRPARLRGGVGRGLTRFGWAALGVLVICGPAFAHGPTIELSRQEMKPPLLNLFVGSTVHFVNTTKTAGGNVVVDASGTIESPSLEEAGADWHYTFEKEGTYELFIRQNPKATSRVVIVPRR